MTPTSRWCEVKSAKNLSTRSSPILAPPAERVAPEERPAGHVLDIFIGLSTPVGAEPRGSGELEELSPKGVRGSKAARSREAGPVVADTRARPPPLPPLATPPPP